MQIKKTRVFEVFLFFCPISGIGKLKTLAIFWYGCWPFSPLSILQNQCDWGWKFGRLFYSVRSPTATSTFNKSAGHMANTFWGIHLNMAQFSGEGTYSTGRAKRLIGYHWAKFGIIHIWVRSSPCLGLTQWPWIAEIPHFFITTLLRGQGVCWGLLSKLQLQCWPIQAYLLSLFWPHTWANEGPICQQLRQDRTRFFNLWLGAGHKPTIWGSWEANFHALMALTL